MKVGPELVFGRLWPEMGIAERESLAQLSQIFAV